jgi:hypothetical protein
MHDAVAVVCGAAVGFSLALTGGGGSILSVPLLVYVVGLADPHAAIGTSALSVSLNAYANLIPHARAGHVRWLPAIAFAAAGLFGTIAGAAAGKALDGKRLLLLFALLMVVVGVLMLRRRAVVVATSVEIRADAMPRLLAIGGAVGLLAGFFGIGGGFLIVPGLILATGMSTINAIASSLVSVGSFGFATAASYAYTGLIAWGIAAKFIIGGLVGGWIGTLLAARLAKTRDALNRVFAAVILAAAAYMLWRNLAELGG